MEIFTTIIIFLIISLFLIKALNSFIIFALFTALLATLYIHINLPILVSIILSIIIIKGCKDTLFNLKIIIKYLFKSKNKFKEKSLGKLVSILFELNFTLFIAICYFILGNYIPYLFETNNKIIAIGFISIYIIQFIKKATLKKYII
nr:hypothetical protein [uncultured Romboutsia sp.]